MGKLIYSMLTSLDGYTEDEHGRFGWGAPEDEQVHSYINALASSLGTYLYGRRMYETMVYWETAHTIPDQPQFVLDWARQWQAAEKIVYSRTLAEPRSARTRVERVFDPDAVRRLKADARHDISVDGPELAAQAIRAGLVDEFACVPEGLTRRGLQMNEWSSRPDTVLLRSDSSGGNGKKSAPPLVQSP